MDMDITRLQQFAQSMIGHLPQGQVLPGMPGNISGGAMAPMNGRLPGGTSSAATLNQPQARLAVLPGTSAGAAMSASFAKGPATKKQKLDNQVVSQYDEGSDDEDAQGSRSTRGAGGSKLSTEAKRFQHCEVEKRRRERMNRYMTELAQMIPACNAVPRRLDKLSILKMAVDHMKNLRGDPHSSSDYKPGFLTDDELKQLVVEAANGFMLIIDCSQAKVLYVSDTISDVLHEEAEGWLGSCFYDLLHPKDIQKVREQLACFDVEEALKASLKQNVAQSPLVMHTQHMNGLRRSFLCRVKKSIDQHQAPQSNLGDVNYSNSENMIKLLHSSQQTLPYQYAVLHCTGFIRNLTSVERQSLRLEEGSTGACLFAVARLQQFGDGVGPQLNMQANENEFVSRVGVDGRFTYVDPRVAGVLGYLPQDLIGQMSYEYYHPDDIQKMVHLHHDSMKRRTPMPTVQYRFLSKSQKWVWFAMKAFSFVNPFSQQVEYVVCTNVTLRSANAEESSDETKAITDGTSSTTEPQSTSAQQDPAQAQGGGASTSGTGGTPHDSDKQERIERYVRMSISSQVEQQLLTQQNRQSQSQSGGSGAGDPLSMMLTSGSSTPSSAHMTTAPMMTSSSSTPTTASHQLLLNSGAGPSTMVGGGASVGTSGGGVAMMAGIDQGGGVPMTAPAGITVEQNAANAQRILDEYNRMNPEPTYRKDMNYSFPADLFSSEVNLEGSQQAYQNILTELENPEEFQKLFNQVEADPFRPPNMFQDIDLDIFD